MALHIHKISVERLIVLRRSKMCNATGTTLLCTPSSTPSLCPQEEKTLKRGAITFEENVVVIEIVCITSLSNDERSDLWYSKEDYALFKRSAKVLVLELRRQGAHHMLEGIFHVANSPGHKLQAQQALKRWCRHGQLGRGIERWINPKESKKRSLEASRYISTVLETQNMARRVLDTAQMAEKLAVVATACSSHAREFALCMGLADAYANEMHTKLTK